MCGVDCNDVLAGTAPKWNTDDEVSQLWEGTFIPFVRSTGDVKVDHTETEYRRIISSLSSFGVSTDLEPE